METPRRKKGGKKRPSIKKPEVKKPSLHSYAIKSEWFAGLPTIEPIKSPAFQFTLTPGAQVSQPEKSFGDLLSELVWEIAKVAWKQTDPASYKFNQAMFELAPYWPPESRWVLGVGAVGSAVYGLAQVADRIEKTVERERNRR